MLKPNELLDDDNDPVAPECRATVEAIQFVLDGAAPAESLEADAHASACATCRERVRAARVLLSVLATPSEPVAVPSGFTAKVMTAVWDERHAHRHARLLRVPKALAVLAIAATILVVAFAIVPPAMNTNLPFASAPPVVTAPVPEAAPAPEIVPVPPVPVPQPPQPPPMRIGDEVAKAGQAFRDTTNPLADSVAVAPKLYEAFASAFRAPAEPEPMGGMLEPARKSLAELPDAAKHGLEPVTGTAQKAFDRFRRDVALVKPKS